MALMEGIKTSSLSEFKEGSIVRLKFENFLTYDLVDIYPGPNLNLVIGPNGTGKSTIVCGICLGLAGKTTMIGRAAQPSEYIKHGCNKAGIEIELYNPQGENWVISREIHRNNTSTWSVNRRSASQKVVEETIANRNIQVGNLCQFLPQDRVADFAKMSKQELLESTEKAIGPPSMYENHCKLKTLGDRSKEIVAASRTSHEQLEKERQKNTMLEDDVRSFQQRQGYMENIQILKQKRAWVEYNEARLKYLAIKGQRHELSQKHQGLQKECKPLQNKLNDTKLAVQKIEATIKKKHAEIKDVSVKLEVKNKQIEDCKEKVIEVLDDLKVKKQDEEQRIQRLRDTRQQLGALEQEKLRISISGIDISPQLDQVAMKLEELKQNLFKMMETKENKNLELQPVFEEKRAAEQNLQKLQDIGRVRLAALSRYDRHAHEAVLWLRQNKGMFRKQIHEPIMTQINVKDTCWAKYLEMQIPRNDMVAFVCEDAQDMEIFMQTVRDTKKLKVNAVMVPPEPLTSFQAQYPIQQFGWCGFKGYLKDLFDAPDGVMRYLCRMHRVHQIPVGTRATQNCLERVLKETPFNTFYTDLYKYTKKRSRYGNRVESTISTEVRQMSLLTTSVDIAALKDCQQKLRMLQETISRKEADLKALKDNEEEIVREQEKLRTEKKRLMQERDAMKNLQARINQKKESIQRMEREAKNIEEEERKTKQLIFTITANKCQLLQKHQSHIQEWVRHLKKKGSLTLQWAATLSIQMKEDEELHDMMAKIQEAQKAVDTVLGQMKEAKAEAHRLLDRAKATTNMGPNDELSDEMRTYFSRLPNTVDEISQKINEEQAKADCMLPTDACVVEEYERRKSAIQHLELEASDRQNRLDRLQRDIAKLKEDWLAPLEELMSRINRNFGKFFASLGCSGEVGLSKGENPEEFDKYGVCIKVKYRDNEELRELTPFHQSGGERSVATVLYMMSLQELTRVPFRCVDEINQGMDSVNERKVFDLVVSTACRENTSQYFLLTPKLLPNLQYADNMTTLTIYNGWITVDNCRWNTEKYIKRRRRINSSKAKH